MRNIAIFAHVDAGKTTVSEQLLLHAGAIRTPGKVDDGTAHTDRLAVEKRRGISVQASNAAFQWKGEEITLIDKLSNDGESVFDEVNLKLRIIELYREMKEALTNRERKVLELRYGLCGYDAGDVFAQGGAHRADAALVPDQGLRDGHGAVADQQIALHGEFHPVDLLQSREGVDHTQKTQTLGRQVEKPAVIELAADIHRAQTVLNGHRLEPGPGGEG